MRAFRIALQKHGATARDFLSGVSGYLADGRWHAKGRYLDYAAETLSLAVLERLVHYKRFGELQPHVLCVLDIPDAAIVELPSVPPKWDGVNLLPAAQALGNAWCDGNVSPAMRVPSDVTPGEFNLLVHARHSAWRWSWVAAPVAFAFDSRLRDLIGTAKRVRWSRADRLGRVCLECARRSQARISGRAGRERVVVELAREIEVGWAPPASSGSCDEARQNAEDA